MSFPLGSQENNRSPRSTILTYLYFPEKWKGITLKPNHPIEQDLSATKERNQKPIQDYHSLSQATLRSLRTSEGLFRLGQVSEKLIRFAQAVCVAAGRSSSLVLQNCADQIGMSWRTLTTFPRAIDVTAGLGSALRQTKAALVDPALTSGQKCHRVEQLTGVVAEVVAMWSYTVATVVGMVFPAKANVSKVAVTVGDSATFAHDLVELKAGVQNFWKTRSLMKLPAFEVATSTVQEAVRRSATYHLLATAKNVTAITCGFFGLLLAASGLAVLPGVALAVVSLSSTLFAIMRKLYEETMIFKPINLLDSKHVTLVTV